MSTQGQGDVSARLIDAILNKPKRRVNRPDDAESGKRLVGWVIDEADAGMSEALFALEGIEDRLRTLLSSSRGEQGWRTMDSAPKNGEFVHLFGEHSRHGGVAQIVCRWDGAEWISSDDGYPAYIRPTHWRPLPSAPGSVPTSLAGQGTDGYVLVPKEPTEVMINEAQMALDDQRQYRKGDLRNVRDALRRAIAAAPQPTAGGDAEGRIVAAMTANLCGEATLADALSAERARVIEKCARLPDDLAKNGEQIKLHAGELTAQEMRSVKAILRYVAAALRALGQQDTGGADRG